MPTTQAQAPTKRRIVSGFTLTEMLVTLLILTLASTLLATGVPIAIDTYQKTVKSANAQMALSTTLTVLRTELGTSADVRVVEEADGSKIYYLSEEGYWASISNPLEHDGTTYRGLEKQYYAGEPTTNDLNSVAGLGDAIEGMRYPLVSDSVVTKPLHVSFSAASRSARQEPVVINNVAVTDEAPTPNELASVSNYRVLLRFDS